MDCALACAAASWAESSVASTSPAVTASPAFTLTAFTVPAEVKLRLAVWAAATVPSAETLLPIGPLVTATSCCVGDAAEAEEPVERNPNHQTPAASTSTAGMITQGCRSRCHHDGPGGGLPMEPSIARALPAGKYAVARLHR